MRVCLRLALALPPRKPALHHHLPLPGRRVQLPRMDKLTATSNPSATFRAFTNPCTVPFESRIHYFLIKMFYCLFDFSFEFSCVEMKTSKTFCVCVCGLSVYCLSVPSHCGSVTWRVDYNPTRNTKCFVVVSKQQSASFCLQGTRY